MNMDVEVLAKEVGAKYDGSINWNGKTYYQYTDSVTKSTIMGDCADHVRRRIHETRKAFEAARECK